MATIGGSLLRFEDKKYICWDTETFSTNLYSSSPWQISWNISQNGKVLSEHDYYIWWDGINDLISEGAKRVTKFNFGEYEELARPPEEVWEIFASYFYNPEYLLVGHNIIHFDIFQLNNLRRQLGLAPDWGFMDRLIDTLALARAYRSQMAAVEFNKGKDFLAWQYRALEKRVKKCTLSDMAKEFEVTYDPEKLHNALYDNRLCLSVFEKLKWAVEI